MKVDPSMELLNRQIFLLLNSGTMNTNGWTCHLAIFTAEWLVWMLPLILVCLWFTGSFKLKKAAMSALISAVAALCAGGFIGWLWPHPRPFMVGLGHLLIDHAADASLPSDHLTLWWGIALGLAYSTVTRRIGLLLTMVGLAPAWARIFVGVHFPFDMLAAFGISLVCAHVVSFHGRSLVTMATVVGIQLQRTLFKGYIPG